MTDEFKVQVQAENEALLKIITDGLRADGDEVLLPEGGTMRLALNVADDGTVTVFVEALRSTDAYGTPVVTGYNSKTGVPAPVNPESLAAAIREIALVAYRGF